MNFFEKRKQQKLAMMKQKTAEFRAKKVKHDKEQKIKSEYKKAKSDAFNRSTTGKVWNTFKTEVKAYKKNKGSSGLFADEAKSSKKKAKSYSNDDVFKKWGL